LAGRLPRLGPRAAASRRSQQPPPAPGPRRAMAALAGVRRDPPLVRSTGKLVGNCRL